MADYRIENHIAELSTKNYLKEYRNQQEFIKYCQACPSYQNSWACPPFEYDPLSRIQHFSYTYIIGSQIHFEQEFINKSIDLNIEQVSRQVMKEVRALVDPQLLNAEQAKGTALAFLQVIVTIVLIGTAHGKRISLADSPLESVPLLKLMVLTSLKQLRRCLD